MSETTTTFRPFIQDGYNERGYIAAVEGLHDAIRFTFRPLLMDEMLNYLNRAEKLKDMELQKFAAKWGAGRLIDWDVVDAKEVAVPITEAAILHLKPRVVFRLLGILRGDLASDIDPKWSQERKDQAENDKEEADAAGTSPGQQRQERDAKN